MNKFFAAAVLLAGALALSGCSGSSIGQACTATEDCDNAQTCYANEPGGYCSKGCSQEGNSKECPGGSICANHAGVLLCSAECQQQSDCRTDYECNGVAGTSVKACSPK